MANRLGFMAGQCWVAEFQLIAVFALGVLLMRSAGCVINDYADRGFDGAVERTKNRPLAAGHVSPTEALQLFAVLVLLSASLLLFLDWQTVLLAPVALALAACYPLMKRVQRSCRKWCWVPLLAGAW